MPVTTTIPLITTTIPLVKSIPAQQPPPWELFNTIIQSQSNIAMIGITVIIGLAVIILGTSWIINLYISKREIENIVEARMDNVNVQVEEKFKGLSEKIKGEIDKVKKEIDEKIEKELTMSKAEQARLFALSCWQTKNWKDCVNWWSSAIEGYAKANQDWLLRGSVNQLNIVLDAVDMLEDERLNGIKERLKFIPDILLQERMEIEEKLKKLEQKNKRQPDLDI